MARSRTGVGPRLPRLCPTWFSTWRLLAVVGLCAGDDGYVPLSEWAHVDDGYFDPFNFDWGLGIQPFNFTLALENRRLEEAGEEASAALRRLAEGDDPRSCLDESCRCSNGGNDADCGVLPEQCPCCIRCTNSGNMRTCGETLAWGDDGILIEDKYYPKEQQILGSCENIDERVLRLDIFGPDKTFRDNELCRELVYQYICLYWGSHSLMYNNRCYGRRNDVALFPCRSMCMRLAVACANNADYKQSCLRIPCCENNERGCSYPIQATDCTEGPSRTGYVSSLENCDVYDYAEMTMDFYSSAPATTISVWVSLLVAALIPILLHSAW